MKRRRRNPAATPGGRVLLPREVLAEDFSVLILKRRVRYAPRETCFRVAVVFH